MELKVWVDGIQRIVCGVTESTTCQDVVLALAHATGKSGRFTLLERWRNNERQLAPQENPLKILIKWGEYSNDVQFILQWNEASKNVPRLKPQSSSPEKSKEAKQSPLEVKESNSPKNGGSSQRTSFPLVPPPYRDPPPPNSAVNHRKNASTDSMRSYKSEEEQKKIEKYEENVVYNAQYRELVSLVNYQREKLSNQQADLTKFDAEINFWEGKEREKQLQLDFIAQEIINMTNASKINSEQIQTMAYVEEENEIVKQQEKTLKSEITLLRSKLANCETELLQCKNKIRLVLDELQLEKRAQTRRFESRKQLEINLMLEMEKLQRDIEIAKQSTELHHLTAENLKKDVATLEVAIIEKKKQVEHLVTQMKEANLQSLTISPPEELKNIFEGSNKFGSTRKMIGSPRQLENAVPTNKNPHGVWV